MEGILAALTVPESIGERVHLATDNRIRAEDIARITREEIGIDVRLADPTLFRNVTLPIVKAALERGGRAASSRTRSTSSGRSSAATASGASRFTTSATTSGSSACASRRPNTEHAFRMLCRHNKFVQDFGKVRDPDEISRREFLWEKVLGEIEHKTGRQVASLPPDEFRRFLTQRIDLKTFTER